MKLGINASRARSGGAKAHLIGVLSECEPTTHGFSEVHVWSYRELLDALPYQPWLVRHCPPETEQSVLRQLWWEYFGLPKALRLSGCDVLLNVDAGTVCRYRPAVTMSRDMLAFEPGEAARFGLSKARLRQFFLKIFQCHSLTRSNGSIFLTDYASLVIQRECGCAKKSRVIPHGVGKPFQALVPNVNKMDPGIAPIQIVYVSPIWLFKHQWHVVRAVEILRAEGFNVQLTLIGHSSPAALAKLERQLAISDPDGRFTSYIGAVPHNELPSYLDNADIFVFASSCENMPNSLIEAMSFGLPIASSDRGPMPEILKDGGVYFDPENPTSIAEAIRTLMVDEGARKACAHRAHYLAKSYSWKQCADQTFSFLHEIVEQ